MLRSNATEDEPNGRAGHLDRSPGPLPSRSEHDGGALGAYRRQMHRSLQHWKGECPKITHPPSREATTR
jgi:hypothetical protein